MLQRVPVAPSEQPTRSFVGVLEAFSALATLECGLRPHSHLYYHSVESEGE